MYTEMQHSYASDNKNNEQQKIGNKTHSIETKLIMQHKPTIKH